MTCSMGIAKGDIAIGGAMLAAEAAALGLIDGYRTFSSRDVHLRHRVTR